ncbi:MAG: hypothetical protein ACOCXP_00020 [Candidatus Dojkabacteria bacterium]
MKKIFTLLLTFLFLITISPVLSQNGVQEEEEEQATTEQYEIRASAEFGGEIIGGITFEIGGDSNPQAIVSEQGEVVVFDDLNEGQFTVTLKLSSNSEYEIVGVNSSRLVELSESNQQESVVFQLQLRPPDVDENLEAIRSIEFPDKLTKIGSTTTIISQLSPEQLSNVQNFTFDNPGVNRIVYTQGLNLENFEEYENITNIGQFIDLETRGEVSFDTSELDKFDAPARIEMSGIRLAEGFQFAEEMPETETDVADTEADFAEIALIEREGETFSPETINYEDNVLSFSVPGFSNYSLVPRAKLLVIDPEDKSNYLFESNEEGSVTPEITIKQSEIELEVRVDNLDAEIELRNGGEVIDFGSTPDEDGVVRDTVTLEEGDNQLRLTVSLANGETTTDNVTIDYDAPSDNSASNAFTIVLIIVILLGISSTASVGAYFYYKKRKKKTVAEKQVETNKKDAPEYEEGLLTEEEKELYNENQTDIRKTETDSEEVDESKDKADS